MARSKFWFPTNGKFEEAMRLGGAGHIKVHYDDTLSPEVENRYTYSYFNVKSSRYFQSARHAKHAALHSAITRMEEAIIQCNEALREIGDLPIV